MFFKADFVARWQHIGVAATQLHTAAVPRHTHRFDAEAAGLGHVNNVGEALVGGKAAGLDVDQAGVVAHHVGEGCGAPGGGIVRAPLLGEIVAREGQRSARVFLLSSAEQIGGEADLGLHLFLAVAEIVVGDQRDHHPRRIAAGDLERVAVVVALVVALVAHPVADLAGGGQAAVGKAQGLLGQRGEMRRKDDRPGVAGPAACFEGRVILGEMRIAGIAKDLLDEVEVRDQGAGGEQADLAALVRARALGQRGWEDRHHEGANQQRDEQVGGRAAGRGVGDLKAVARRLHGRLKEPGVGNLGDFFFIARNGEAAGADMEGPRSLAAIRLGIVEHALAHPVAGQNRAAVFIAVRRQAEQAGEARLVEQEAVLDQAQGAGLSDDIGKVAVEKVLQPLIRRAEVTIQQADPLAVAVDQVASDLKNSADLGDGLAAIGGELEFEVLVQAVGHDKPLVLRRCFVIVLYRRKE